MIDLTSDEVVFDLTVTKESVKPTVIKDKAPKSKLFALFTCTGNAKEKISEYEPERKGKRITIKSKRRKDLIIDSPRYLLSIDPGYVIGVVKWDTVRSGVSCSETITIPEELRSNNLSIFNYVKAFIERNPSLFSPNVVLLEIGYKNNRELISMEEILKTAMGHKDLVLVQSSSVKRYFRKRFPDIFTIKKDKSGSNRLHNKKCTFKFLSEHLSPPDVMELTKGKKKKRVHDVFDAALNALYFCKKNKI